MGAIGIDKELNPPVVPMPDPSARPPADHPLTTSDVPALRLVDPFSPQFVDVTVFHLQYGSITAALMVAKRVPAGQESLASGNLEQSVWDETA